jgi:hypothetical protein
MGQITLQFCAFDSAVARIIAWGTESDVGHVDIVLAEGSLLGAQHEDGMGGMPAGVQVRPANYLASCGGYNIKRVALPTSDVCERAAYDWAQSMIGTPYDTKAIEGIALGDNWSHPGRLICSGFAAGMLTQPSPSFIGHQLERPWRIITPGQLLLICNGFAPVVSI